MTDKAICLFCKDTEVLIADWNKRCPKCKEKQTSKDEQEKKITVGKRMPAARIVTKDGKEVWVDKFGEPVDSPGYDLKNDPRGWKKTGTQPNIREVIK